MWRFLAYTSGYLVLVFKRLCRALFLALLVSVAAHVCAQPRADAALGAAINLEYQVKAAFIFNFANFTTWPASAFTSPTGPLAICIVGSDPFEGALEQVVSGEHVGSHPLAVEHRRRGASLQGCQMVFVSGDDGGQVQVVQAAAKAPILTIGETDQFWRDGGMIAFQVDGGHVRFDVNQTAAKHHGLELSSKLLRVAWRVK
ncbi:MAG TPA: YfiR family protein [Vicinamibacterales bacterium]|jgi:hypothetical protein